MRSGWMPEQFTVPCDPQNTLARGGVPLADPSDNSGGV